MQSIPVFPTIIKTADYLLKNADVSRTQGLCRMNYVFFGSSLDMTVPSFINVGYVLQILERGAFPPICEQ